MRIFLDIIFFFSIVALPIWCTGIIVLIGLYRVPRWYEAICGAFVIDLMYRAPTYATAPIISHVPLALMMLAALLAIEVLRTRVRENILQ
jgi:hypothetical protein